MDRDKMRGMAAGINLTPLPTIDVMGKTCKQVWFSADEVDVLRRAAVEADRRGRMPSDDEIEAYGSGGPMSLAVALDFADNPRPYGSLAAPADTNGELSQALRVLAAEYRALLSRYGSGQPAANAEPDCWCETCRPITMQDMRMVLCPICGNKRCPHATDHRNPCTGSNEAGQPGSSYEHCAAPVAQEPRTPEFNTGDPLLDVLLTNTYYLSTTGGMDNALLWIESLEAYLAHTKSVAQELVLVGWTVSMSGGGILHAAKYTEDEAKRAGYPLAVYRLVQSKSAPIAAQAQPNDLKSVLAAARRAGWAFERHADGVTYMFPLVDWRVQAGSGAGDQKDARDIANHLESSCQKK